MKNGIIKSTATWLTISTMIVAVASGCGNKSESSEGNALISKEPIKFTYWVKNDMSKSVKNYSENLVYQELEKRTGVKIEFVHPVGVWYEQLNLMFASKDLPDIIETVGSNTLPTGVDQAIEDKMVIRLNELVDQHAPNFKKARESSDEARRLSISDKGNLLGFGKILLEDEPSWGGPNVRKDLMDKLNITMPTTISEWYTMLKAFKDDGVEIPLMVDINGWDTLQDFGVFIGAFGVNRGFINDNGKVKFGPFEPGYKEFLSTFQKWYQEGLLDSELFTRDGNGRSQVATAGKAGSGVSTGFGTYEMMPAPYPTVNKGEKAKFRQKNWRVRGYEANITTACKKPDIAVKWFDYHYSPEGAKLFALGIEDKTYKMENGEAIATDLLLNDPDGFRTAVNKYTVVNAPFAPPPKLGLQMPVSLRKDTSKARAVWSDGGTEGMLPLYSLTNEEKTRSKELMGQINPYVGKMFKKFINGEETFDKYDEYIKTLKSMGVDEAISINQAAYERLMKRK